MTDEQPGGGAGPDEREYREWRDRTRITLSPIAPPAVLGLFAFGGATWPVSAHLAGWYGGPDANTYLWEFGALFGGGGQLVAAVWSYRARNALGTGLFGLWGFWWLSWGLMVALDASGSVAMPGGRMIQPFGFWYISTGVISLFGTVAALKVNLAVVAVTFCTGTASLLAAAGYMAGNATLQHAAGADFFAAATFAVYTGGAIMLMEMWGRPLLPLGNTRLSRKSERIPERPIQYPQGMPGSRVG